MEMTGMHEHCGLGSELLALQRPAAKLCNPEFLKTGAHVCGTKKYILTRGNTAPFGKPKKNKTTFTDIPTYHSTIFGTILAVFFTYI